MVRRKNKPTPDRSAAYGSVGLALLAGIVVGLPGAAADKSASANPGLQQVGDFDLPGKTTRWDYLSLDTSKGLLFIAHLGDSEVVVVDTKNKAVAARIPDVGHVHGTLALPDLSRVYASATATDEVVAIDTATLKVTARMPGGVYPDGMAYAPEVGKLYVSDENGNTETVIDLKTNQKVGTIPLGGKVGNTQYDPVTKRIYINVQGQRELVIVDPVSDKIVERVKLPDADGNHGLLLESVLRLAFIACEDNNVLLVLNMETNKVVSKFEVGKDPDVLAYDAGLGRLYVAGEAGIASIFSVSKDGVTKISDQMIGPNAHAVAIDPATHEVYFPLKDVGGKSVLRVMKPAP